MNGRHESIANLFGRWLSSHVPSGQLSEIYFCYPEIEKHGYKVKILQQALFETTDILVLSKLRSEIEQNRIFRFWHKKQMKKMGLAMTLYIAFVKEYLAQQTSATTSNDKTDNVSETVSKVENPQDDAQVGNQDAPDHVEEPVLEVAEHSQRTDDSLLIHDEKDSVSEEIIEEANNTESIDNNAIQTGEEDTSSIPSIESEENTIKPSLREAIIDILKDELLLTSKEIVDRIVAKGTYIFTTRYSKSMVSSTLSHYSKRQDEEMPAHIPVCFGYRDINNSKRKYYLLEREVEVLQMMSLSNEEKERESITVKQTSASTIKEAIIIVLSGNEVLLSSTEIYERIVAAGLFEFGAQNPVGVVYTTLCRACRDSSYTRMQQLFFGKIETPNNEKKFYLLSREKEVQALLDESQITIAKKADEKSSDKNLEVLVYNFDSPDIMAYTRPESIEYFGNKRVGFDSWTSLYTTFFSLLLDDYPDKLPIKSVTWLPNGNRFEIADEANSKKMIAPKLVPGTDVFIETNYSAKDLLNKIKLLLDKCYVDYENVVITYIAKEKKSGSSDPQKRITTYKRNSDGIEDEFKEWMETKRKLGKSTCRGYVSAIRTVEKYAKDHGFHSYVLMTYTRRIAQATVNELFASEDFVARNKRLHNLYSAAINQLFLFIDYHNGDSPTGHIAPSVTSKREFHGKQINPNNEITRTDLVQSGDTILSYFSKVKEQYPELEFTNVNAHGDVQNRAVYVFFKNQPRRGNVLFEIWQLNDETKFDLYIKRSLLSDAEYSESVKEWNKTTESRGRLTRQWYYRHEMISFLQPKLEMTKGISIDTKSEKVIQKLTIPDTVAVAKYEKVLREKFQLGFRLNSSIELKKFKRLYAEMWDENFSESDDDIVIVLKSVCLEHDGRLYLMSTILDKDLEEKMLMYICDKFQHGKKIIYIDALYREFSDEILSTHSKIYNVDMLRLYLCHIANDRFYVYSDFISQEKNSRADISEDLKEFLLLATKPVEIEKIYQGLSHVSQKEIKNTLFQNIEFINNGRNHFFHVELLGLTDEEITKISAMIRQTIDDRDYLSGNELYQMIKVRFPYIIERNPLISIVGLRDGIKYYLYKSFLFESNIISDFNNRYSITKIFTEYGKKHRNFTYKELEVLARELGAQIPLYAVNKNAIKINQDDFVSADQVHFQVKETDTVLDWLCKGDYISIQSITEFSAFPYAGFPWNTYLLEQYVSKYSERFVLLSKGINRIGVAGGIVRRTSGITEFDELLIDVLSKSNTQLKKDMALSFLVEEGYLTSAYHKTIEEILIKAKAKRNTKGK